MEVDLGKTEISKIFWTYAIPGIIGMLANSTAQLIDAAFIGRVIGSEAVASITLVMPIIMVLQGVAIMVAVGGSTYAGISKGRGEQRKSNNYFNLTISLLLLTGFLSTLGILLIQPFLDNILGIGGNTLFYVKKYSSTLALFFIFYMMNFMFSFFLNIDGKPRTSVLILLSGSLLNIILDYLFIYRFQWGIRGAAMATGLSQFVPWITFFIVILNQSSFKFSLPKIIWKDIYLMLYNGSSELLSVISVSVASVIINGLILRQVGVSGVAAYTVALQIANIVFAVSYGIADSTRAAASFNYGAKNESRVRSLLHYSTFTNLIFGATVCFSTFFGGEFLSKLFLNDKGVIIMAVTILKFYSLAYMLIGLNISFGSYYTSVDSPLISASITFLRSFGILIPLMLIFSFIWGADGIWYSISLNEALVCIISLVIYKKYPMGKQSSLVYLTSSP